MMTTYPIIPRAIFAYAACTQVGGCLAPEPAGLFPVEAAAENLNYNTLVRWPGGNVPVCFSTEATTDFSAAEQLTIRELAESTWERVARIDFTGWGQCASQNADPNLVLIRNCRPNPFSLAGCTPGVSGNGKGANNFVNLDPQRAIFRGDVVHEFGHILGFNHEHERPEGDDPGYEHCAALVLASSGAPGAGVPATSVSVGTYDQQSIMNYCASAFVPGTFRYGEGYVSETDVRGAREAYGARPVQLVVYNPSTAWWSIDANGSHNWSVPPDLSAGFDSPYRKPLFDHDVKGTFLSGVWRFDRSGNDSYGAGDDTISYGSMGDIPVLGYWAGRHTDVRLAVYNPINQQWSMDLNQSASNDAADRTCYYGYSGGKPAHGNWSGSLRDRDKVGSFKDGNWLIDIDDDCQYEATTIEHRYFGSAGDIPVPGDYDGNGKDNLAVFNPSTGQWSVDWNDNGVWDGPATDRTWSFGSGGDLPTLRFR
ncbi:MAG: hypothetical protein EOP83_16465 [Verrucomicrobiaceae bacterium]|nr:MAG: hypothetical protein EOP83_16465 [Verrucomicrobiaceae bacterium]